MAHFGVLLKSSFPFILCFKTRRFHRDPILAVSSWASRALWWATTALVGFSSQKTDCVLTPSLSYCKSVEGLVENGTDGEAWLCRVRMVLGYELIRWVFLVWCEGQAVYGHTPLCSSLCVFCTKQFCSPGLVFPAKPCLCGHLLLLYLQQSPFSWLTLELLCALSCCFVIDQVT